MSLDTRTIMALMENIIGMGLTFEVTPPSHGTTELIIKVTAILQPNPTSFVAYVFSGIDKKVEDINDNRLFVRRNGFMYIIEWNVVGGITTYLIRCEPKASCAT